MSDGYGRGEIVDFLQRCGAKKGKPTYLAALKKYFEFLGIGWPIRRRGIKIEISSPPTHLTPDDGDVGRMLEIAKKKGKLTYAILRLLVCTGIRRGELCSLDRLDFNPPNLRIRMEKGEGYRLSILDEETAKAISSYLSVRKDRNRALFALGEKRVRPDYITKLIKSIAKVGKVDKLGFGAHSIRRYLAKEMIERGAPLNWVQGYFGWKSEKMPLRYSQISSTAASKLAKDYHPFFRASESEKHS